MDKSFNKIIKSQVKLMVLSVIAVVLVCASASYALFQTSHKNTTDQVISIGTIATGIEGTPITLSNIYPMEESELTNDYPTYSFTITNTNGVDNYDVNYELFLTDNTSALKSGSEASTYANYEALSTSEYQYINYRLDSNAVSNLGAIYNSETGKMTLQTGELLRNKSEEHTIRFWLSTSAPKSVQGKVLSLQMNMTSTPINNYICSSAESKFKFLDEEGNILTCTNLEVGTRIAIGDGETQQVFRYLRTTDISSTLSECGTTSSVACADATDGVHRFLAEYNLKRTGAADSSTAIAADALQDPSDSSNTNSVQFGASNSDYSQSYVKTYMTNYQNVLNTLIGTANAVTVDLMTLAEIRSFSWGCPANSYGTCSSIPTWAKNSNYWLGSAYDNTNVWRVDINGSLRDGNSSNTNFGARPVIEISSTNFNTYKR